MAIVNVIVEGNTLNNNAFEDQAVNLDTKDAFEISEDELELSTYDEQQCYYADLATERERQWRRRAQKRHQWEFRIE